MNKIDELAKEFLSQKNIAVAGVRRNSDGVGNLIYRKLKETGHNVFTVNPNAETIENTKCFPDIKSIPEKIDAVVIATKSIHTKQIVKDCIEARVSRVWMHNTFGKKGSDKPASSISGEAVQLCTENNISVIPGGCPMMFCEPVDFGHKCLRGITRLTGGFRGL
jgi:hypothetical protein